MWDVFKDWIFNVIAWFQNFCGDWGLAIIIVTVILRIILTPLMHKSQKSSYMMNKLQPEVQRIQERFPDDKQRQNAEIQKIYADNKYNPLRGCVPMLIQMPIFIALFQTLRELTTRDIDLAQFRFYDVVPNLATTPSEAFAIGFVDFIPYLILMLIFAFATFVPMLLQPSTDPKQKKTTLLTAAFMSLMMLWLSWSSPAGVLLFWGTSSILAIAQNQISKEIFKAQDKKKEAEVVVRPVEVSVARKTKKKRASKKR